MTANHPFVVHLSATDITGGAGRAAYRLHAGLNAAGTGSAMLVRERKSSDQRVRAMQPDTRFRAKLAGSRLIEKHYLAENRSTRSDTLFTNPWPGFGLAWHPWVQNASVINLHWMHRFVSPTDIAAIAANGTPMVWTMHDMNPFTGGCHYSAGCDGFVSGCDPCPQLARDPFGFTGAVIRDKQALWGGANIAVAAPSRWLAEQVRRSTLFTDRRVEVIPNGVETGLFSPGDASETRAALGVAPDAVAFIFGAVNAAGKRKGFQDVLAALRICLEDEGFRREAEAGRVVIIGFGHPSPELARIPVPVINAGTVTDDAELVNLYRAADAFVLPSLEDNLPNTMVESMACGVSVIGYATGGIPDMVEHGVTGLLADTGDVAGLARIIADVALRRVDTHEMGHRGRKLVEREHTIETQGRRYSEFYERVRADAPPESASTMVPVHYDAIRRKMVSMSLKQRMGRFGFLSGAVAWFIDGPPVAALVRGRRVLGGLKRRIVGPGRR